MPADAGENAYNARMKYSLLSLMIVVALLPPAIGFLYWIAGLPLTISATGAVAFWLFVLANRRTP